MRNKERLVTLTGTVVPWYEGTTRNAEYKLECETGIRYLFVADEEWRKILSFYKWEEVKVTGLLNPANRTVIPHRVTPKNSDGQRESALDLAFWRSKEAISKLAQNINDLILLPIAVLALAGFGT